MIRTYAQLAAWLGERTFRLRAMWWNLLTALVALAWVLALLTGATVEVVVLLGILLIAVAGPAWQWLWLKWPRHRTRVALARFGDEAGTHADLMRAHLAQLQRRIAADDLLPDVLDVRALNAAVDGRAARRILGTTPCQAVVGGTALVAGDTSRWEAALTVTWGEIRGYVGPRNERVTVPGFSPPMALKTAGDYELPIIRLTGENFPANHADGIEGTLCVLASQGQFPSISKRLLDKAEQFRPALPVAVRAILEIANAMLAFKETGDPVTAAKRLEKAGARDADHVLLWNAAATLYLEAEVADPSCPVDSRLRVSLRGLEADPGDPTPNANAGIISFQRRHFAEAREYLERAMPRRRELVDRMAVFCFLAMSQEELGDYEAARATWEQLVREEAPRRDRKAILTHIRARTSAFQGQRPPGRVVRPQ